MVCRGWIAAHECGGARAPQNGSQRPSSASPCQTVLSPSTQQLVLELGRSALLSRARLASFAMSQCCACSCMSTTTTYTACSLVHKFRSASRCISMLTTPLCLQTVQTKSDLVVPANPAILDGVNDLTSLSYLNEPSILYDLQQRYSNDQVRPEAHYIGGIPA